MVMNIIMLEYMLICCKDVLIIEKFQGMLKYIVLDEVYSYIGFQVVELVLFLCCVMQVFNVGSGIDKFVQIIVIFVIIGEDFFEGNKEFVKFVVDFVGVIECDVKVVCGY